MCRETPRGTGHGYFKRYSLWQAPHASPICLNAAATAVSSPAFAAVASASPAADRAVASFLNPAMSVQIAGAALVSPLSLPSGNSVGNTWAQRWIALPGPSNVLTSPFA